MIEEITTNNINNINDKNIKEEFISLSKNNPFASFLIYKKENIITGYLYYSEIYNRIEINQFFVYEKYRNKGYASKMLEHLIKKNKSITLEVKCNNKKAINLYKKYGFKTVTIRKGYYNGIDGNLMILETK